MRRSSSAGINASLETPTTRSTLTPGGARLSDQMFFFFFFFLWNRAFRFYNFSQRTRQPPPQEQHRACIATGEPISTSSLLPISEKYRGRRLREAERDGATAALQRRLNPDLFLALWLPVNHRRTCPRTERRSIRTCRPQSH